MKTSATSAGIATTLLPNVYLLRSSFVAALRGLLFGFDTAVISGATSTLSETFALSPLMLGITVSSDVQAVVIGFTNLVFTLIAMSMIDRLGRLKLLLFAAMMVVQLFVVLTPYPEINGVSLEKMGHHL